MSSRPTRVEQPFSSVGVLGLGAMGGSLARALSALPEPPRVTGWSPQESERTAALEAGAVVAAPERWEDAVADAELVVLAAPLEASRRLVAELAGTTTAETTLSDVASLKAPLARAATDAGVEARWVGSHPMAGTAESGFQASRPGLYVGATVWTVAHPSAEERVPPLHTLWRALGARPAAIDAESHDRLMALASHLPQLVANALASVLDEHGVKPDRLGPGGRDMTRLAASGSELWRDILGHASAELTGGLRELAASVERIAGLLERGDLDEVERLMTATRGWSRPS
jgi:prephenate dehydrogenase